MEVTLLHSQGQDGVTHPGRAPIQHLCPAGLPAQLWEGAADVALGGDRVCPSPAAFPGSAHSTAQLIYLGEGINKRVITAIYIKLDILKALCKH